MSTDSSTASLSPKCLSPILTQAHQALGEGLEPDEADVALLVRLRCQTCSSRKLLIGDVGLISYCGDELKTDSMLNTWRRLSLGQVWHCMVSFVKRIPKSWTKLDGICSAFLTSNITNHNRKRRLVFCHLELSDLETCRIQLAELLKSDHTNPVNHYLAYSLALETKDDDKGASSQLPKGATYQNSSVQLAMRTLESLGTEAEMAMQACVSRTLEKGSNQQTARILLKILEKHDRGQFQQLSLTALLRYALSAIRVH